MGKMIYYVIALIILDILFIATGQICTASGECTLSSIMFNAILDIGNINTSDFFSQLIGNVLSLATSTVGLAALLASTGVLLGTFLATREIKILFIPMALTLALIAGDFVIIGSYLISINALLGVTLTSLVVLTYIIVIVEWLRGKD